MERVHFKLSMSLVTELNEVVILYHQCDPRGGEGGGEMGDREGQAVSRAACRSGSRNQRCLGGGHDLLAKGTCTEERA